MRELIQLYQSLPEGAEKTQLQEVLKRAGVLQYQPPYSAKLTGKIESFVHQWANGQLGNLKRYEVGVYNESGDRIGHYHTNPFKGVSAVFEPILRGDQWYALFSENLRVIKAMRLPSMEVIAESEVVGSEISNELYCPRFQKERWSYDTEHNGRKAIRYGYAYYIDDEIGTECQGPWESAPFAFYSSWDSHCGGNWVTMLDISKIEEGVITAKEHGGYDCPEWMSLRQVINMRPYSMRGATIDIALTSPVTTVDGSECGPTGWVKGQMPDGWEGGVDGGYEYLDIKEIV